MRSRKKTKIRSRMIEDSIDNTLPILPHAPPNHNHWIQFDVDTFPKIVVPCIVREKAGRLINYLSVRITRKAILNLLDELPEDILELSAFRFFECEPDELNWLNKINAERNNLYGEDAFKEDERLIHADMFLGYFDRLKKEYSVKSDCIDNHSTLIMSQPIVLKSRPRFRREENPSPLVLQHSIMKISQYEFKSSSQASANQENTNPFRVVFNEPKAKKHKPFNDVTNQHQSTKDLVSNFDFVPKMTELSKNQVMPSADDMLLAAINPSQISDSILDTPLQPYLLSNLYEPECSKDSIVIHDPFLNNTAATASSDEEYELRNTTDRNNNYHRKQANRNNDTSYQNEEDDSYTKKVNNSFDTANNWEKNDIDKAFQDLSESLNFQMTSNKEPQLNRNRNEEEVEWGNETLDNSCVLLTSSNEPTSKDKSYKLRQKESISKATRTLTNKLDVLQPKSKKVHTRVTKKPSTVNDSSKRKASHDDEVSESQAGRTRKKAKQQPDEEPTTNFGEEYYLKKYNIKPCRIEINTLR